MKKYVLCLCLLAPQIALAQFGIFNRFFGDKKAEVPLEWRCGSATGTQFKIKVSGKDGNPKFETDPSLTGSKARPYLKAATDECWSQFTGAFEKGIKEWKAAKCEEKDYKKHIVCNSELGPITSKFVSFQQEVREKIKKDEARIANRQQSTNPITTEPDPTDERVIESGNRAASAILERILTSGSKTMCAEMAATRVGYLPVLGYNDAVKQNMRLFNNLDQSCKNTLVNTYVAANAHILDDNNPRLVGLCKDGSTAPECKIWQRNKDLMRENIAAMLAIKSPQEDLVRCAPDFLPLANFNSTIEAVLAFEKSLSCVPLRVGDTRIYEGHAGGKYKLNRSDEKNYEVTIPIRFIAEDAGVDTEEMFRKTQSCMKGASDFLKSADGRSLRINVVKPEAEPNIPALPNNVKYERNVFHPDDFALNMGCGTILHEVLHHLGLPDLYRLTLYEDVRNNADKFCEVVNGETYTPTSSVMGHQGGQIESDRHYQKTRYCQCNETCQKIMNSGRESLKAIFLKPAYMGIGFLNCTYKKGISLKDEDLVGKEREKLTMTSQESDAELKFEYSYVDFSMSTGEPTEGIQECTCKEEKSKCLESFKFQQLGWNKPPVCPGGNKAIKEVDFESVPNGGAYDRENKIIKISNPRVTSNLLKDVEFRSVIQPKCREITKKYDTCNMYLNHLTEGKPVYDENIIKLNPDTRGQCPGAPGNMSCAVFRCSTMPDYCKDGSWLNK